MSNLRPVANGNRSDRITNNEPLFAKNHPNNRFFDGKFIPEDKTIHWTCNKGKYVRAKAKTSKYLEGKHNYVRSKDHVVKTRNCIATKNNLTFSAILTLEIPSNSPGLVFEFTIIDALRIFSVLHNSTVGKRLLDGRQIVVEVHYSSLLRFHRLSCSVSN